MSFFGGDCKSYFKIASEMRSIYHSKAPKDRAERWAWVDEGKANAREFHKWKRETGYKTEGYASRELAEAALKKFDHQPPVPVEIVEYSWL